MPSRSKTDADGNAKPAPLYHYLVSFDFLWKIGDRNLKTVRERMAKGEDVDLDKYASPMGQITRLDVPGMDADSDASPPGEDDAEKADMAQAEAAARDAEWEAAAPKQAAAGAAGSDSPGGSAP